MRNLATFRHTNDLFAFVNITQLRRAKPRRNYLALINCSVWEHLGRPILPSPHRQNLFFRKQDFTVLEMLIAKVCCRDVRSFYLSARKVGPFKARSCEIHSVGNCVFKICIFQNSTGKISQIQPRIAKIRSSKKRAGKIRLSEVSPLKLGLHNIRATQLRLAKIHSRKVCKSHVYRIRIFLGVQFEQEYWFLTHRRRRVPSCAHSLAGQIDPAKVCACRNQCFQRFSLSRTPRCRGRENLPSVDYPPFFGLLSCGFKALFCNFVCFERSPKPMARIFVCFYRRQQGPHGRSEPKNLNTSPDKIWMFPNTPSNGWRSRLNNRFWGFYNGWGHSNFWSSLTVPRFAHFCSVTLPQMAKPYRSLVTGATRYA